MHIDSSLIVIVCVLGCGAIVKGITGAGLPMIALPILAGLYGVPQAIGILTIPSIISNLSQAWTSKTGYQNLPFLWTFLVSGLVGIVIGSWVLVSLPDKILSLGAGFVISMYILLRIVRIDIRIGRELGAEIAPVVGILAGILQGATGLSGPIGVTFIHMLRLPRDAYIFIVSVMFLIFSTSQFIILIGIGSLSGHLLLGGVAASIPVVLLMPLGASIGNAISPRAFDVLLLVLMFFAAAKMIYSGLS